MEIGFRIEDVDNYTTSCVLDHLQTNIGLSGKLDDVPLCLEYFALELIDKAKSDLTFFLRNALIYNTAIEEDDPITDLVEVIREIAGKEELPLELLKKVTLGIDTGTDCVVLWFSKGDIVKC